MLLHEILRLRGAARARLGAGFELHDLNDAIVSSGGVPPPVLELVIGDYIKAARGTS